MKKESNDFDWKIYIWLLIGLLLLIVILPIYIYLVSYQDWFFDLNDKGGIGDAIGGITAPIIGIIGAVLVFLSFTSQVKANILLSNQNEFKLMNDLIIELKRDILYIYDKDIWDRSTLATPFLAYLKKGDIKTLPPVFKRKLMYVFNDYIFLNERQKTSKKLEESDKKAIINSLENIYDCYLDNYCSGYQNLDLKTKPAAKLSKKLQELAIQIIEINSERPIIRVEDDLDSD